MDNTLRIALAGNPNSGKTTLFNAITGAHQHVGNYPGITVEKKVGFTRYKDTEIHVTDLPGTYSLTAYTQEEIVTRSVLAEEKPEIVIDVVNASALERNLYLTVQLLEMGAPVVLALNMIDEANKQGLKIHRKELAHRLNIPVIKTVARREEGIKDLIKACLHISKHHYKHQHHNDKHGAAHKHAHHELHELCAKCTGHTHEASTRHRHCTGQCQKNHASPPAKAVWNTPLHISYGPDLDPVLERMEHKIYHANLLTAAYAPRWTALKLLESDNDIQTRCMSMNASLTQELMDMVKTVSKHLKTTLNTYPEAVVADYRYGFIASVLRDGVITRPDDAADRLAFSDKLDAVLTQQVLGPVILLAIMWLMYEITFVLGAYPIGWVEDGFGLLKDALNSVLAPGLLQSLLVSGIIDGVGGVMVFVPLIMIIFFQIAFLEDSGYMARMAYMLDRVFRLFGLHGCSVMPFIIGGGIAGGCAVPGVMAARTLRSPREKLATLLTVPFMACGAKLPVFLLFVGVFFSGNEAQMMFLLTLIGWTAALLVAFLLRSTIIRGEATPFVMELPPYRLPTWRGLLIHTWERTWEYLKKAGTIILAISILLWAAMTFPQIQTQADLTPEEQAKEQLANSYAGRLGKSLEPITKYAGFDWRTDIALIGGFAAKEVIVATLGTAYSLGDAADDDARLSEQIAHDPTWNKASAMALMIFVLLYAPCVVTVAVIRQETGSSAWAVFSMVFNTLFAFAIAVSVYQIGTRLL